jgi:hypothetical protein
MTTVEIHPEDVFTLLERHDYALLNMHNVWPQSWHEGLPLKRLELPDYPGHAHLAPGLLDLSKLDSEQYERIANELSAIERGQTDRMFGSLIAAPDVEEKTLSRHLANRLILHTPEGKAFFRLCDPRVLIHMSRLFIAPRLRQFFGPIAAWTIPFDERWVGLEKPEEGLTSSFWSIDARHFPKMSRLISVNPTLKEIRRHRDRPWRDMAEFHEFAEKADVAVAEANRIFGPNVQNEEIVEFAFQSYRYGAHFFEHPRIQNLLAEVRANGWSWRETTIMHMSEADWAQVSMQNHLERTSS